MLKENTGRTTTELIGGRVIQEAKVLLKQTSWTVSEISDSLGFAEVAQAVQGRCAMCHAREVFWPGLQRAPKGVMLDTAAQIEAHATLIHQQVVVTKVMPPGNLTQMTDAERAAVARWYEARTP